MVRALGGSCASLPSGDIPDEWLRDGSVQLAVYLPRLAEHPVLRQLIEGAIRTQAYFILSDPWANSFRKDWAKPEALPKFDRQIGRGGWVATRNFEVDRCAGAERGLSRISSLARPHDLHQFGYSPPPHTLRLCSLLHVPSTLSHPSRVAPTTVIMAHPPTPPHARAHLQRRLLPEPAVELRLHSRGAVGRRRLPQRLAAARRGGADGGHMDAGAAARGALTVQIRRAAAGGARRGQQLHRCAVDAQLGVVWVVLAAATYVRSDVTIIATTSDLVSLRTPLHAAALWLGMDRLSLPAAQLGPAASGLSPWSEAIPGKRLGSRMLNVYATAEPCVPSPPRMCRGPGSDAGARLPVCGACEG